MFNFFQKDTPESLKAQAKANYEKAVALKSESREATSMRVRIAILCKAHLDSAFIEGAEKTGTWQELCALCIARGEEKPEMPKPSYFHRVKTQGADSYTYTYIPEEFTDEVFELGRRYQTTQIDALGAINMVQRIADEICTKDLKLSAPFKALQFLRDELEFGEQAGAAAPDGAGDRSAAGGGAEGTPGG